MALKKHATIVIALVAGLMIGCSTGSVSKEEGDTLMNRSQASRQEWNKGDPQFEAFAKKGYGFAFFPEITKGGLVVAIQAFNGGLRYQQPMIQALLARGKIYDLNPGDFPGIYGAAQSSFAIAGRATDYEDDKSKLRDGRHLKNSREESGTQLSLGPGWHADSDEVATLSYIVASRPR